MDGLGYYLMDGGVIVEWWMVAIVAMFWGAVTIALMARRARG